MSSTSSASSSNSDPQLEEMLAQLARPGRKLPSEWSVEELHRFFSHACMFQLSLYRSVTLDARKMVNAIRDRQINGVSVFDLRNKDIMDFGVPPRLRDLFRELVNELHRLEAWILKERADKLLREKEESTAKETGKKKNLKGSGKGSEKGSARVASGGKGEIELFQKRKREEDAAPVAKEKDKDKNKDKDPDKDTDKDTDKDKGKGKDIDEDQYTCKDKINVKDIDKAKDTIKDTDNLKVTMKVRDITKDKHNIKNKDKLKDKTTFQDKDKIKNKIMGNRTEDTKDKTQNGTLYKGTTLIDKSVGSSKGKEGKHEGEGTGKVKVKKEGDSGEKEKEKKKRKKAKKKKESMLEMEETTKRERKRKRSDTEDSVSKRQRISQSGTYEVQQRWETKMSAKRSWCAVHTGHTPSCPSCRGEEIVLKSVGSKEVLSIVKELKRSLRVLIISDGARVENRALASIATCSALECLDVEGSGELTVSVAKKILKNCGKLQVLDINGCLRIDQATVTDLRRLYPDCLISYLHAPGAAGPRNE